MNKKYKKLRLRQLDSQFKKIQNLKEIQIPAKGWIWEIRNALGMSHSQLAKRLKVSAPAIANSERSEAESTIKISTLKKTAENFLLGIHKDMFGKTWKWAGQIRKSEKNIGSAPERIREHLKILIDDVKFWLINTTYSKDETCVRFHRRIVGIHLFPNGNGRHARFVTDLLAESLGIQPFTWGSKDLYNPGEARTQYINALKEADKNNYEPLLKFVRT